MNILVPIKQALCLNTSSKDFRIDPATNAVKLTFARYHVDQFDEIALEVAIQCRDAMGGQIRAITVGPSEVDDVLRHALAMKADHATLVETAESQGDTAVLLAAAARHYGGPDIVLCGRTSSDNGTGQTGPKLAELLDRPFVGNVVSIQGQPGKWLCRCETPTGYEVLEVTSPFVGGVSNADTNVPRARALKDVMKASRAPIETLAAATLCPSIDSTFSQRTRVLRRFVPVASRTCQRIEGEPRAQAKALAGYIRNLSAGT